MVDLSEFKSDTRAIRDGMWIRVNPAVYGDLEILSRGFTDEFYDAQNARMAKAAEQWGGDRTRITNSEQRTINASLLEDFLVIDVRNLKDGGVDVPVSDFHVMLYNAAFQRLSRACWEAAGRVTVRSEAQIKAAEGNSPPPCVSISNGAKSEAGLSGA